MFAVNGGVMPKKEPRYLVFCGDASFYFKFGRIYRLSYLRQIFRKKLAKLKEEYDENQDAIRMEFFPGLTLKDGKGNLWRPEVKTNDVKLVLLESQP
jgi:hypothetical protein